MFTLSHTPITFVGLLLMFTWSTLWSARDLARARQRTDLVSGVFHLVMALVMLAMVPRSWWGPLEAVVPAWLIAVVMLAGAGWFVAVGIRSADGRGHHLGHAVMFAAMAWHLLAMTVAMSGMAAMEDTGAMAHGGDGSTASTMDPGRVAVAIIGLPLMAWLAYAAIRHLIRVVRAEPVHQHPPAPVAVPVGAHVRHHVDAADPSTADPDDARRDPPAGARAEALAGFAMNGGMFWMSAGLLAPVLPFMAAWAV